MLRKPSRVVVFALLLFVYLLVTLSVVYHTPMLTLDHYFYRLHTRTTFPSLIPWIKVYVMLGQRGPATLLFLPWICYVAWRGRSPRPLLMLAVGLVLLNISVGIVKVLTGRLGPMETRNTHSFFQGGSIYPSGHVSNAVLLYGVIAMIAVNHHRLVAGVATFLSVTVGLGTLYRHTHWFSDVLAGWIAGALVLIAIPWVMPLAERVWNWVCSRVAARAPWVARLRTSPDGWPQSPGSPTSSRSPDRTPVAALSVAPRRAQPGREPAALPVPAGAVPRNPQPGDTPVSSAALSHSAPATRASLDARDESTRRGKPRTSPIPSGP